MDNNNFMTTLDLIIEQIKNAEIKDSKLAPHAKSLSAIENDICVRNENVLPELVSPQIDGEINLASSQRLDPELESGDGPEGSALVQDQNAPDTKPAPIQRF